LAVVKKAAKKTLKKEPKKVSEHNKSHISGDVSGHIHHDSHNLSYPNHNLHHPSHHEGHKKARSGIKVLKGYSILLCFIYIFYFVLGIYKPNLLFLGGEAKSYAALVLDVILVGALIYLIYGITKRKGWAWWFCIVWYSASIINSIWSVYIMRVNVYNILHELLILSSVFIVLINALIIWYAYSKREYFMNPHHGERFEKKDKIFTYSLVCFWVLLLLISTSIGYDFYKTSTRMADSVIEELKDTTPLHAIEICETKEGAEKDICFVVFVTIFERYDLTPICGRIESDLYRFSCMQAKKE